jgi:ParB-like chromosome segregation protein Spo0J
LEELSVAYSPRQETVNVDHVAALVEVIASLPPIVVDRRTMTLIDGIHRLEAHRLVGRKRIEAVSFSGDETEGRALAIRANVRHGKPLTRRERQDAALMLLQRCPERSDRWLGEVCGLSHSTVARLRRTEQNTEASTRIGRDGRRRPVDAEAGRAEVSRLISEDPSASLRKTAEAAAVAPSTAQRVASKRRQGRTTKPPTPITPPQAGSTASGSLAQDPAFQSSPELIEFASWLTRTAVTYDDFRAHLSNVPLGRVYEIVDECRRRATTWGDLADSLETRARPLQGS